MKRSNEATEGSLDFSRIYFDTCILEKEQWPTPTLALQNTFEIAKELSLRLVIPLAVQIELEQHVKEAYDEAEKSLFAAAKGFVRKTRRCSDKTPEITLPSFKYILSDYQARVKKLEEEYGIQQSPITLHSVDHLFRLAARKEPPLQKDDQFRDAVIYLSILDELLTEKSHGVFLSCDKQFVSDELKEKTKSNYESRVRFFISVEELNDYLSAHITEKRKATWYEEKNGLMLVLKENMPDIQKYVNNNLEVSQWTLPASGALAALNKAQVKSIKNVELPFYAEVKKGQTESVKRKVHAEITFSAELKIELDCIWQDFYTEPFPEKLKVGQEFSPKRPVMVNLAGGPGFRKAILTETFRLNGTALVSEKGFDKIGYSSIELVKPKTPEVSWFPAIAMPLSIQDPCAGRVEAEF